MALYDITAGAVSQVAATADAWFTKAAQLADNKVVVIYGGTTLYAKVGTLSGTTWTWGTEATLSTGAGDSTYDVCKADTDKFAVIFRDSNNRASSVISTVSGTTITVGTEVQLNTATADEVQIVQVSANKVFALWGNNADNYNSRAACATISGTTATWGTIVEPFEGYKMENISLVLVGTDKVAIHMYNSGAYDHVVRVMTVSGGTTITMGTQNRYEYSGAGKNNFFACQNGTDSFLLSYHQSTSAIIRKFTISGTDASVSGSNGSLPSSGSYMRMAGGVSTDQYVVAYKYNTSKVNTCAGVKTAGGATNGTAIEANAQAGYTGDLIPINLASSAAARYGIVFKDTSNYPSMQIIDVNFSTTTTREVTITAKARIKKSNIVKSITAKSRMKRAGVAKTITAKSRVKKLGVAKTVQAKSRIKKISIITAIQAKSRIKKTNLAKSVTAKARVKKAGVAKTISAKAYVQNYAQKIITAKARIKKLNSAKTITAKGRIKRSGLAKTIRAKARVKRVLAKTITAKATVRKLNVARSITAKAKISQEGTVKSVTAKARLKKTGVAETITARSRVKKIGLAKTVTAKARVKLINNSKSIRGKASVRQEATTAITAKARIKKTAAKTIGAKARVQGFYSGFITLRDQNDYAMKSSDQSSPVTLNDGRIL